MASVTKATELVQGVGQLADEFKALNEQLEKSVTFLKTTQEAFNKQSKSQGEVANKTKKVQTANEKIQAIQKKEINLRNQINQLNSEAVKKVDDLTVAKQRQAKTNKEDAKLRSKLVGEYEKESIRLNRLRKQYKDLAAAGKENTKAGKALLANVNKLDKKLKDIDSSVGQNQRGVGNYTESIKRALGPYGILIDRIQTTTNDLKAQAVVTRASIKATNGASKAMKIFKLALISTGIGAFVVLLGSLISYFTGTQRGADALKRVFAALGATVDVLKDRIAQIGEGLIFLLQGKFKQGIEKITSSFKGLGEEIKNESKSAKNLTRDLQELQDKEIEFIEIRDKLKNQIEELRLASKDANLTDNERLNLLKKAASIQQELSDKEVGFSKERARISQAQLDLGESTREQIKENAELQAEATRIETESLRKQRTIQSEIFGIQNRINSQSDANSSKIIENTKKVNDELKNQKESFVSFMDELSNEDLGPSLEELTKFEESLTETVINEQNKRFENETNNIEKSKQLNEAVENDKKNVKVQIASELFNFYNVLQERELASLEYKLDKGKISEEKYAKEVAIIKRKQAVSEKLQGIFNAGINTAEGITSALALGPVGIPLAALIGILGGIQVATIAAKPIPKFRFGGEHKGGPAEFSEEGSELFIPVGGAEPIVTPEKRTVGYMPAGQFLKHDDPATQAVLNGGMTPEQFNELIKKQDNIEKAIKSQHRQGIDKNGTKYIINQSRNRTTYINKWTRI